ncbi:MAG: PAS domain-containing protein, partial [Proteobacteria bacterium]|nr:PAS domain-containing protein [Pseudomonadota bacterium]
AELAGEFQKLSRVVCEHKKILAQAVEDRTAELFESRQQLNMILDTVEAFIYIKDKNYQYVYANRAVQKLLNKGLDAIVGQQCEDFF